MESKHGKGKEKGKKAFVSSSEVENTFENAVRSSNGLVHMTSLGNKGITGNVASNQVPLSMIPGFYKNQWRQTHLEEVRELQASTTPSCQH
jgi:hypothetical protein